MDLTTPKYWDCECKTNYIHKKETMPSCGICLARQDEQPDSRIKDVVARAIEFRREREVQHGKNLRSKGNL